MRIKKGEFGYCVSDWVPPDWSDPANFPLQMRLMMPGIECPLQPGSTLLVTDMLGRRLRFTSGPTKMLESICTEEEPDVLLDEVDIDPVNGVWHFLAGLPKEQVPIQ